MPLDVENLDDLRWADMVATIRRRIPAASAGSWTLHAPVDPGITLLDLFAWQLEQRVYTMNRIPDALSRSAMALLGNAPRSAVAATTVMRFDRVNSELLPAFTTLVSESGDFPLVFSTLSPIALLPIQRSIQVTGLGGAESNARLAVNGIDRTLDLQQGPFVELFPSDGTAGEVQILMDLTGKLPPASDDAFAGLLFDLVNTELDPQWSPTAVDAPPAVTLKWFYSGGTHGQTRLPLAGVVDGTGAFRRSGVVRFPVPADWQPISNVPSDASAGGYALWVRVDAANFTFPPRLQRLVPNAVMAGNFHRRPARVIDAPAWLPLPGQKLDLTRISASHDGLPDVPPFAEQMVLQIPEIDGKAHDWTPVPDLVSHGPGDRVFILNRQKGILLFGDGLTGRIPRVATAAGTDSVKPLTLTYMAGGGPAGNVGNGLQWFGTGDHPNLVATNVFPARSGAEEETVTDARTRVAAEQEILTRAVTADDYEKLCVQNGVGVWIARAHAEFGLHPGFSCPVPGSVSVFVVPGAPRAASNPDESGRATFIDAPVPDAGLLAAVRQRLEQARLITTHLFVRPPVYREVEVSVSVSGLPADPDGARTVVFDSLREYLDPLNGGDDGNGWPFGEPLRSSTLLRVVQNALGSSGDAVKLCMRLMDQNVPLACCGDLPIKPHELVVLRKFSLQFLPSSIPQGGLT